MTGVQTCALPIWGLKVKGSRRTSNKGQDKRGGGLGATWLALERYGQDVEAPIGSNEVSIERSECSGHVDTDIS